MKTQSAQQKLLKIEREIKRLEEKRSAAKKEALLEADRIKRHKANIEKAQKILTSTAFFDHPDWEAKLSSFLANN